MLRVIRLLSTSVLLLSFLLYPSIKGDIVKREGRALKVNLGKKSGIRLSMATYILGEYDYKGYKTEYISAKGLIQELYDDYTIVMIDKTYKDFNLKELKRVVFARIDFKNYITDLVKFKKTIDNILKISMALEGYKKDFGLYPPVSGEVKNLESFEVIINNKKYNHKISLYIDKLPLKDEWGNDLYYKTDINNPDFYFLYSIGKDKTINTKDDIICKSKVIINKDKNQEKKEDSNRKEEKLIKNDLKKLKKSDNQDKIIYFFGGESYVSERLLFSIGDLLVKTFHPLSFHRGTIYVSDYFDNRNNRVVRLRTEYRTFKGGNVMEYEIVFNKLLIPIDFRFIKDTGEVKSTSIANRFREQIIGLINYYLK